MLNIVIDCDNNSPGVSYVANDELLNETEIQKNLRAPN